MLDPTAPTGAATAPSTPKPALRQAAQDLEAAFLAEMLKQAGLGKSHQAFGGGAGEEQFSSFLVQEQASLMAQHGGIGLAERLFAAMQKDQANG
ncbi:rod-binding protein [Sinirhodobacter sp. WL0062]|uniref:Rod-binding protein n=1 Tax=Rhodobacter flavimaris TaxID=2907145 RepID=A0ABS8YZ64_9RHOB|nr:rod-binding protein [Sinirhodobacter sp. WL0062]MCE5974046.1 rod-binding protein [Sinirhodobacter sp. WL0062]